MCIISVLEYSTGEIKPCHFPSQLFVFLIRGVMEVEGVFIAALCETVEPLTALRGNFHFLLAYARAAGVRACVSQRQDSEG